MGVKDHRAYNERKLKDFLYYLPDYHEQAYKSAQDEIALTGEGNGDPFGAWLRATIDDDPPGTKVSHKVLTESVEVLRDEHWHLYMRLLPVYFSGPKSRPWLPDTWEEEARDNSSADRIAYRDYLEAIIHMMDHIEWRLPQFKIQTPKGERPMERLVVPVPSTARYQRASSRRKKRRDALDLVHEYREYLPAHMANRLAAQESGYSLKEIRVIVRQHDRGEL